MTQNAYTGEVPLQIGDLKGTLLFNWDAMAAMRTRFGNDLPTDLVNMNPADLAELAAIGFKAKSPAITAEKIMAASPAILDVATAVDRAMLFAYHGPEKAQQIIKQLEAIQAATADAADALAPAKSAKKKRQKATS